jgi:hypothetical protein
MSRRLVGSLRACPQSFRLVWNQKKDSGLILDKTRTRARTTKKGNPVAKLQEIKISASYDAAGEFLIMMKDRE